MSKVRIAVLCSGGGTNFQAILSAQQAGMIEHGEVVLKPISFSRRIPRMRSSRSLRSSL